MRLIERIKTKPGYKILGALLVLGALIYTLNKQDNNYIDNFKSGKYTLQCNINGDWKTINPSKIQGFDDETGYYIFTNGFAKNCVIVK